MTNEIEKTFFDTFGIEPTVEQCYHFCNRDLNCKECDEATRIYPTITDHILLGLICIANEYENYPETTNMKNIKERTLRILLRAEKFYDKNHYGSDRQYKKLIKQVHTLFKENN